MASNEALLAETRAALDRYNIVLAVTSGCPIDLVLRWKEADPDRIVASPYIGGGRGCWPDVDTLRDFHSISEM